MRRPVISQADDAGRYTATSMYRAWKGWSFADKKSLSPWLTFLVLRVQRRLGAGAKTSESRYAVLVWLRRNPLMELFPALQLGWLNGWLLAAPFYLVYGLLLRLFPEEVVGRLYDRSGWTRTQRILSVAGLPFALAGLILLVFTPLKIGQPVFIIGLTMYGLGFVGFVVALFNFKNAPLDRPATEGLYKYSRNPQWVTFALTLVGAGVAVGSGIVCLLFGVRIVFNHFRILGEEKACLDQYGDVYREYLTQVPRYVLFF